MGHLKTRAVLVCLLTLFLALPAQAQDSIVTLINQQRAYVDLPPLRVKPILATIAQAHSEDMATHNFVSHYGSDGRSPWDRMEDASYDWAFAGETIGCAGTASAMVTAWMRSPEHRKILLSPLFTEIGAGYAYNPDATYRHYWTVDVGHRVGHDYNYFVYLPTVAK